MSAEETIIEEEQIKTNEEIKSGKNSFSRKMGNALRRSKRLLSGKRRSFRGGYGENGAEKTPPFPSLASITTNTSPDETSKDKDKVDSSKSSDTNGEVSPRRRRPSQTFFSSEKQVEIDGRKIKEIEIVGEKSIEPIDMKKQKKLVRKKSLDQSELNIACRDLGRADFEGWLQKKAGGHGLIPVSWKRYWCVAKSGKLYCYKTSFDIAADYALPITSYTVEKATEKKKITFKLTPNTEEYKLAVFAGDTENDVNTWVELINKILSGIDVSKSNDNGVPEYEERHRMYSASLRAKDDPANSSIRHKQRQSSAFAVETETTGMPAGFGARTQSNSQPRVRKMSSGGAKPESCLAVGSMFKPLDVDEEEPESPENDADLKTLLFREVEVETTTEMSSDSATPAGSTSIDQSKRSEMARLNAEIDKLNNDMVVLNKDGERKSEKAVSNPPEFPSVKIDSVENTDMSEASKIEGGEEAIKLQIKDEKFGQERTTSQIFRDFAAATEGDEVLIPPEEPKVEVKSPQSPEQRESYKTVEEEIEISSEPIEKPPVVEEDQISEIRKSSEIDAETVISELEAQAKSRASEEQTEQIGEGFVEETAYVPGSDSEIVDTGISVTIIPEEDDDEKKENHVEETYANAPQVEAELQLRVAVEISEIGNEVATEKSEREDVAEEKEDDTVEMEKYLTPTKSQQTKLDLAENNADEVSVAIEEETSAEKVSEAFEEETSAEKVSEAVEEETSAEKVSEAIEEETSVEKVSEAIEVETLAEKVSEAVEEETSVEKVSEAIEVETLAKLIPRELETLPAEETKDLDQAISKNVANEQEVDKETPEEKNVEGVVERQPTEQPQHEASEVIETVVVTTTEADPSLLQEHPAETSFATAVTTETDEQGARLIVETTVETTTEMINMSNQGKLDNERDSKISLDLGEDLDVPNLCLGGTSLSDEINIQLGSPSSDTEQSFIIETSADAKPQLTEDATHVISVN